MLSCLLAPRRDGADGGGDACVLTVWQLLGRLGAPQLKALTACPAFFDLPHVDAPREGLPPRAVEAMLEVRRCCCCSAGCCVCVARPALVARTHAQACPSCTPHTRTPSC